MQFRRVLTSVSGSVLRARYYRFLRMGASAVLLLAGSPGMLLAQSAAAPPRFHRQPGPAPKVVPSRPGARPAPERRRTRRPRRPGIVPARRTIVPASGLSITVSGRLRPGTYSITDTGNGALQVTGSNIVLDGSRVKLRGDGKGTGLHLVNAHNVTIRGLDLSGYLWGVVVEGSTGVVVQDCVASHNGDLPAGTVIDESGRAPEDTHGGGFLFRDCQHCRLLASTAEREWDALDIVRCQNNTFRGNTLARVNNWGVHLWGSSHNTVAENECSWCTTGEGGTYQALTGWATYDSAGVLIEHDSSFNLVQGNDLRYGGDGLFIRANEGPAAGNATIPPLHPSNHNLVENNDCSFSPNNAVEGDLCDDNSFVHNNCSRSNYGFWLGYSRRAIVRGNTVVENSSRGIQIENGQDDLIEQNTFINRPDRPKQSLVYLYQNGRDATPSGPYRILQNTLVGSETPLESVKTVVTSTGNHVISNQQAIGAVGKTGDRLAAGPEIDSLKPDPAPVGGPAPSPAVPETWTRPGVTLTKMVPTTKTALQALPGSTTFTIRGKRLVSAGATPVVEIDGVPAYVLAAAPELISAALPYDFWNHPAPAATTLVVFNGARASRPLPLKLQWNSGRPRVMAIDPTPARPGQPVTVIGQHLMSPGGVPPDLFLNGLPVHVTEPTDSSLTFAAPGKLLSGHGYNLILKTGLESYPIPIQVAAPAEWQPHIISASFSPQRLATGDLLHISAVVKNNAPFTLAAADPRGGFIYNEPDSFGSRGFPERFGLVYLRATSDRTGGSWPYMWGLTRNLPPGETETIDGYIRMETAGTTIFKVGLVDGRVRWIDDSLYPTEITIIPANR